MAMGEEERAFILAQLAHDDLVRKLEDKDKLSKNEQEELDRLEVELFEARKNQRLAVAANLQAMDASSDQPTSRKGTR